MAVQLKGGHVIDTKFFERRALCAHNRRYGLSIDASATYLATFQQVRVKDGELGIVTYWNVNPKGRRKVSFHSQLGERA